MKWITHKTFAVATTLGFGFPLGVVAGSFFGSTLPDQIDFLRSSGGRNRAKWGKIHRGISHFWLLYFVIFIPLLGYFAQSGGDKGINLSHVPIVSDLARLMGERGHFLLYDIILGLFLGALSHILSDMLNPSGVPILPSVGLRKRFSFNLFPTNSIREYLFLGCLVIYIVYYSYRLIS